MSVCFGFFLPPTLSWEGGSGKELPKSGVEETHSPPEGKALNMQNTQARAGSEQEGGRCCDLLVQKDITAEPRGKLSQGTRTQGGQPVVKLVASVMEQQRMRVTSQ